MLKLNNFEINVVSGGVEVRFCDIEKKGDAMHKARFSFLKQLHVTDARQKEIFDLILTDTKWLNGTTPATTNIGASKDNYNFSCYQYAQDE